jgi:hypothetical protein
MKQSRILLRSKKHFMGHWHRTPVQVLLRHKVRGLQ